MAKSKNNIIKETWNLIYCFTPLFLIAIFAFGVSNIYTANLISLDTYIITSSIIIGVLSLYIKK